MKSFQSDLNQFVEKINKIFIDNCQETFRSKILCKDNSSKVNQSWFNNSCHSIRKAFIKREKL